MRASSGEPSERSRSAREEHEARELAMGYAETIAARRPPRRAAGAAPASRATPTCARCSRTASARSPARSATRSTSTARRTVGGEVSHVVLSGAALDLPGFAEALQTSLGVEVRSEHVGVADAGLEARSPRTASRSPPAWPRGGAAMRAVNLIPADQRGGGARSAPGARRAPPTRCSACSAGSRARAALRHRPATRSPADQLEARVAERAARSSAQAEAAELAPYTSFIALREQRDAGGRRSSSTRASTGLTRSTSSAACCRIADARSPR